AGELDPMAQAILDQSLVHKFAAVVDVKCPKGKGQANANALKGLNNKAALANYKGRSFGPAAGNIGQYQAVNIAAAVNFPTMGNQIHFHAPGERLVPVREGPQRNAAAWLRHRPAGLFRAPGTTRRTQGAVN